MYCYLIMMSTKKPKVVCTRSLTVRINPQTKHINPIMVGINPIMVGRNRIMMHNNKIIMNTDPIVCTHNYWTCTHLFVYEKGRQYIAAFTKQRIIWLLFKLWPHCGGIFVNACLTGCHILITEDVDQWHYSMK